MVRSIQFILLWCTCLLLIAAAGCGGCHDTAIGNRIEVTTLKFPENKLQGTVNLKRVFSDVSVGVPVRLASPNDGTNRIFVVDKNGYVRVFENRDDVSASSVFLNLTSVVDTVDETGLLGFAFDPNFSVNGYFYVYYCVDGGNRRTRVSRFTVSANPNQADVSSELILFEVTQPTTIHKGGSLAFNSDGYLYVSIGDAGSTPEQAQDKTSLRGKVLRIDVSHSSLGERYRIPPDNPFVGAGGGAREEIYAFGFRNPWRMTFDRASEKLWLADVGQNLWEEIDIIEKGGNYGWQNYEGNHVYNNSSFVDFASTQAPIFEYSHNGGGASITGGFVYNGTSAPSLIGKYIYADFVSGNIWSLELVNGAAPINTEISNAANPVGFGEDIMGELYVLTASGEIFRMEENPDSSDDFPKKLSETGIFKNTSKLEVNPGILEYDLNHPFWSDGLLKRRWLALPGFEQIQFSATDRFEFPVGTVTVKQFDWDLGENNRRRIETRVFIRHKDGLAGYTYEWNKDQTDANLISAGKTLHLLQGNQSLTWPLPSRGQCMGCHTASAKFVLGLETPQLNRDFTDHGNQLEFFNELELFDKTIGAPENFSSFAAIDNLDASVEKRARAYLHTNCSSCHRPGENNFVGIDFRYTTALKDMSIKNIDPTRGNLGVSNAKRLSPGHKEKSLIYLRMIDKTGNRMPPFGTHKVDSEGADVVGQWIDDQ